MSKAEDIKREEGVEIPIEDENSETVADEATEEAGTEAEGETEAGTEEDTATEAEAETVEESESGDPWETKYMRLMADFQNYKKRTAKEVSDIRSSATEKVMTKALDVLDNFERAFDQGSTDEKFAEGVENIFNQLIKVLEDSGLKEMEVLGEDFDPNFHNAAVMEDTDEYESGKICGIIQKGYSLNGKVIRPPMVKVAK